MLILWSVFLGISACGEDQTANISTNVLPDAGKSIQVIYGGNSNTVDLGKLPTTDIDGVPYVRLSEVLVAAVPGKTVEELQIIDFVAADGFTPSSRDHCLALLPVFGPTLAQGYIEPTRGNLRWDSSLQYPGCMSVKSVEEILVEDKKQPGNEENPGTPINEENPGTSIKTIYVNTLSWNAFDTELFNGVEHIKLSDVLKAAFPGKQFQVVDFVADDGFSPTSRESCNSLLPVDEAALEQGYINPLNRNLSWDASLGYPGCMRVSNIAEIWVEVEN